MSKAEILLGILCGLGLGIPFAVEALAVFAVRDAPIVTGHVLSRELIRPYSIPRIDYSIRVDGTDQVVHARVQRYLLDRIPQVVRFRYDGDPRKEVFLFEHE